jgi:hypothetical protein
MQKPRLSTGPRVIRGLTETFAIVRLGIVKLTVIANHIFLALIADILKLQFVTMEYLLIDNRVIRVFANCRHAGHTTPH